MTDTGLAVKGLVKRYPGFQLGPLTFALEPGKAHGLLGPNGAGKTTLLNCLACQSRTDAGQFRWCGRTICWGDWNYRQDICFLRETPVLYDDLTAGQTLRFASRIYSSWDDGRARKWVSRLNLPLDRKVRFLSKGMRVKLSLLVGIAYGAQLLLLDEPTAGLDPDVRAELQKLLRELIERGRSCLLISSHIFEDIEFVCDEVKILSQGRIVFDSPLLDLHGALERRRSIREIYFEVGGRRCAP